MRVVLGVDQLHVHAHFVAGLAHTAFENRGHAELLRDVGNLFGRIFESLRRGARDHFQVADARKSRQDFLLDAVGEINISLVFTQIFERQHGD